MAEKTDGEGGVRRVCVFWCVSVCLFCSLAEKRTPLQGR